MWARSQDGQRRKPPIPSTAEEEGERGCSDSVVADRGRVALPRKQEKTMSNKPTIILVHGFWGGAAHWSKVILAGV
ncbi:hypothetical protein CUJ84_Chr000317 [Rhizobium leguminosarum]|uniref:Alpha/beta hydrolase n=1 Tax=Rhizobium leguminosarum TaxID=384 RepID=A0A2K9YXL4_RHILE|nr:hypothetical protein CUJ84_Chr000317 [Rhizobium leguminosarum]